MNNKFNTLLQYNLKQLGLNKPWTIVEVNAALIENLAREFYILGLKTNKK